MKRKTLMRGLLAVMLVASSLITGCGTVFPGGGGGKGIPIIRWPPEPKPRPPELELPTETDATEIDANASDYTDWWDSLSSEDQAAWQSWWDSF